jgi:hypothetical protein
MEAVSTSETSVSYETTRRNIPESCNLLRITGLIIEVKLTRKRHAGTKRGEEV